MKLWLTSHLCPSRGWANFPGAAKVSQNRGRDLSVNFSFQSPLRCWYNNRFTDQGYMQLHVRSRGIVGRDIGPIGIWDKDNQGCCHLTIWTPGLHTFKSLNAVGNTAVTGPPTCSFRTVIQFTCWATCLKSYEAQLMRKADGRNWGNGKPRQKELSATLSLAPSDLKVCVSVMQGVDTV